MDCCCLWQAQWRDLLCCMRPRDSKAGYHTSTAPSFNSQALRKCREGGKKPSMYTVTSLQQGESQKRLMLLTCTFGNIAEADRFLLSGIWVFPRLLVERHFPSRKGVKIPVHSNCTVWSSVGHGDGADPPSAHSHHETSLLVVYASELEMWNTWKILPKLKSKDNCTSWQFLLDT